MVKKAACSTDCPGSGKNVGFITALSYLKKRNYLKAIEEPRSKLRGMRSLLRFNRLSQRAIMVVVYIGRSDIDQRFIAQRDILESEILMTLGYAIIKECCNTVSSNLLNKNGI